MPNLCPQRQAFNKLENYRLWPCIKKVPPTPVVLHTHTHNEILLSRCLLKQHAEKKCLATAKHFFKKKTLAHRKEAAEEIHSESKPHHSKGICSPTCFFSS